MLSRHDEGLTNRNNVFISDTCGWRWYNASNIEKANLGIFFRKKKSKSWIQNV